MTCPPLSIAAAEAQPLPPRFVPRFGGQPMRGPYTARQRALPWNVGRQFFSGGSGAFLWADGTERRKCACDATHSLCI